jgi:PAS domain S-box-containing protein
MTEKINQLNVFKTLVEFSPDWLMLMNEDQSVRYISPAVRKITGYEPQDFIKDVNLFKNIIHPEDRDIIAHKFKTVTTHHHHYSRSWTIEFRIIHKNGDVHWIEHNCQSVIDDANKRLLGLISSNRDITDKKHTEQLMLKMSLIVEQSAEAVALTDTNGNIEYVNPAFERTTGYLFEEVKGKNPRILKSGKQPAAYYKTIWTTITNGNIWRGHFINKKKNGNIYHEDAVIFPIFDNTGKIINYAKIARDMTEFMETISALEESEEKCRTTSRLYRLMADNIPDLIWAKDLKSKFIFVNKAVCEKLLGAGNTDEPIGKDDMFFANRQRAQRPEQKDWFTFGELCINSDEVTLKAKKTMHFDEFGNVHGKFLYLDVRKSPLFDEKGNIIGTVGSGRIVTREKEIEKKLIASEKHYHRIFKNAQDAIFECSAEGRFLDINPAGLKLFGYSSLLEIQKINARDLYVNPSDRLEYMKKLESRGFVENYEICLKKKDGSKIIVLENATANFDQDNKIISYIGFIRNITRERKLEKQLVQAQRMESIGTLAGGVAHDFNNLLTVINGYSEMALRQMDADNPLRRDFESIFKAGKQAENLTRQLLAFSRKQIFKPEIVSINQVILSIYKMLRRLIGEDIDIKTVMAENLPYIKADKSQIEQILINLVVNARDAVSAVTKPDFLKKITIETGQVYLDKAYVDEHPGSATGRHIFFAVSDNGLGMDEKTKIRIFEPFFTTKDKYKGTGLGLAMVYGIVKQNNGSIFVYSEPDEGTMFKIYWPAVKEKSNLKQTFADKKNVHGNETILVVEDEDEVRCFVSKSLKLLGYRVYKASNGKLALDLLKKEQPEIDLILTDLIMPELNGKEFVEKVRKLYPYVKVIYTSGYTDNHIVHNGSLEQGANFIQKPYSIKILASTIRKIIDEK